MYIECHPDQVPEMELSNLKLGKRDVLLVFERHRDWINQFEEMMNKLSKMGLVYVVTTRQLSVSNIANYHFMTKEGVESGKHRGCLFDRIVVTASLSQETKEELQLRLRR